MRDAKNEDEYRQAWTWHINQLATLALQGRIEYDEYKEMKQRLEQWIDRACTINNATKRKDHE